MSISLVGLEVRPVSGRIGAEVLGVDLSQDLDNATVAAIRQALLNYRVLFFRQQSIEAHHQVAFARRFGEITTAHPTVPSLPNHPAILDLDYGRTPARANFWHTDVTFVDHPPLGSILRSLELPEIGGDTLWGNTVAAYDDLPPYLQALAQDLWAVHSNAYDYASAPTPLTPEAKQYQDIFSATAYETLHPIVRVHPETQERGLFIGGFVRQIRGLSTTESTDLLRLLQSYVVRPENTVRWRWQLGDVAFWDNRATQHYAIYDYGGQLRRMQRVTIAGDIPVSVRGTPSQALQGDSSSYTPQVATAA